MNHRRAQAEHIKANASKKLRNNLRILTVVYSILFFITLYNLIVSRAIFWQVVLAMVIGIFAGIISSRMYKISWNKDEAKVVGRMDIYGAVALILFIVFELNRTRIAEIFASGTSIGSLGLVLITGALFGRIFGTARQILRVLRNEKIVER